MKWLSVFLALGGEAVGTLPQEEITLGRFDGRRCGCPRTTLLWGSAQTVRAASRGNHGHCASLSLSLRVVSDLTDHFKDLCVEARGSRTLSTALSFNEAQGESGRPQERHA